MLKCLITLETTNTVCISERELKFHLFQILFKSLIKINKQLRELRQRIQKLVWNIIWITCSKTCNTSRGVFVTEHKAYFCAYHARAVRMCVFVCARSALFMNKCPNKFLLRQSNDIARVCLHSVKFFHEHVCAHDWDDRPPQTKNMKLVVLVHK